MAALKAAKDLRTVFIRGISFDANEKDIEELFSDVGPVKQCFLVRVKDQPKHRGFGFVQYALPEDAERAITECSGKSLKGRKLQVELADKRASLEERKKKRKLGQDGDGDGVADDTANTTAPAPVSQPPLKASGPKVNAGAAKKIGGENAKAADSAKPDDDGVAAAAAALPPRKRQRAAPAAGVTAAATAASEKHKLLRAVAIGNLTPASISLAVSLARKVAPAEEVLNPAPPEVVQQAKLEADGCSGNVVIVIYKTVKDAMHAVTQLHNKTLELRKPNLKQQHHQGPRGKKGRKGTSHQQQQQQEEEAPEGREAVGGEASDQQQQQQEEEEAAAPRITLWAREVKGEGAHVKQWRIILRNLPFKVTEAALLRVLSPAGFVWDLKLPRNPDGRLKGFAFATFTCRAHADKAIATTNGKDLMGRMVVADWAVSKTQYLQ
ncbi:hypothetical protein VaNZ11_004822, partial [Volvox africanus]